VRELENTIERAVVLANSDRPRRRRRAPPFRPAALPSGRHDPGGPVLTLDELERTHILAVLELCEGGKTKAAALLGINRTTLWKKLRPVRPRVTAPARLITPGGG
jgi:DNA-binding NtrC family response regulator